MFEYVGRMLCYIVCATIVYVAIRLGLSHFGYEDVDQVSYWFGFSFGLITWRLAGVFQP